jgi:hypothetical protein
MIRIIYLTCAVASPDTCAEGVITVHVPVAPAMCAALAQAELAARAREGWRIARWRCETRRETRPASAREG